jgi:pyrroline-5-carboxylate reductase
MNVALIGCGHMGSALAKHLAPKYSLTIYTRNHEKGKKVAKELGAFWAESPMGAIKGADVVILAVQPRDLSSLSSTLELSPGQIVVSVLAGISISRLNKCFPEVCALRMMPNLAITTKKGVIGCAEDGTLPQTKKIEMEKMFADMGMLHWISEKQMHAFSSLAASSPAFIFTVMEAMIDAGIYLGFSSVVSEEIVVSVLEGCLSLLKTKHESPGDLKKQIMSPGGMTVAGIRALESGGIRKAFFDALDASFRRSMEMSGE